MIIDAWVEPAGDVVLMRSRLFPRHVAVLLSARRDNGRIQRRTCIRLGSDVEAAERGVIAARLRQLLHRPAREGSGHDSAS
ncbi:MAG TPA: hypothetical protein VFC19_43715 [Candidatus Limnocylindrales bacterium]|nr:hypothetical protein [Candidatus Limnocylindrales bacterium]